MIIYKSVNKINHKVYIGQTCSELKRRKTQHESRSLTDSNNYFHNAINKYGKSSFDWSILCHCDTQEQMNRMEQFYIMAWKSADREYGYNLSLAVTGHRHSEETKKKIGMANSGKKRTAEQIEKIRLSSIGNKSRTGQKLSDETKRKMSLARTGKPKDNGLTGHKHSDETKKRMSEAMKKYHFNRKMVQEK